MHPTNTQQTLVQRRQKTKQRCHLWKIYTADDHIMAPQTGSIALPAPNGKQLGNTHPWTRKHIKYRRRGLKRGGTSHIPHMPWANKPAETEYMETHHYVKYPQEKGKLHRPGVSKREEYPNNMTDQERYNHGILQLTTKSEKPQEDDIERDIYPCPHAARNS